MKSPKPIVAGALFAGTLLLGGGIAAAVTLPDEASDTAKDQVADVETGQPEDNSATANDKTSEDEVEADEEETEAKVEDETKAEETKDADEDEAAESDEEDAAEHPDNHGADVSTAAHAEYDSGRAKGVAVSAIARSNGQADADHGAEDEMKPAAAATGRPADAGSQGAGHGKK